MKITICSLLLLTATAFADNKVQLSRLGPAEAAPPLANGVYACDATKSHIAWTQTELDARKVDLLHECGQTDVHTQLAFEAPKDQKGVYLYTSAIIGYQEGHMTDAPQHTSLVNETFSGAKLKGGKHALLHRVDTLQQNIAEHSDGTRSVESSVTQSRVDVCRFDTDGTPMCGYAVVECPQTGCKAPEIIKGALWIHAKDGRKRYTIE